MTTAVVSPFFDFEVMNKVIEKLTFPILSVCVCASLLASGVLAAVEE